MERLYVVVRADLPPGLQMAQAVHAAVRFALQYHDDVEDWERGANNVVVLAARDEAHLEELTTRAIHADARVETFREPDLGNQRTAVAFDEQSRPILSSLPKALRLPKAPSRAAAAPIPCEAAPV